MQIIIKSAGTIENKISLCLKWKKYTLKIYYN